MEEPRVKILDFFSTNLVFIIFSTEMGYQKFALFLLYIAFLCQLVSSSSLPHLCPNDQALALLQFKHMFTINAYANSGCTSYQSKVLSWNKSTDCCSWGGVHCEETTGQVIELDLSCSGLQGKFDSNSSLFQLANLKMLDLSFNNFSGSLISPKFGEFSSLTDLDLGDSGFSGQIPSEISRLSKLYVLRIGNNDPSGLRLGPHNFELLLKNLTQLRVLALFDVNISSTIPLNFSSFLTTLDLLYTQLFGILPERVFHLTSIEYLLLGGNNLNGQIECLSCNQSWTQPQCLGNMSELRVLDLSKNSLNGTIDTNFSIGNQLEVINLDGNKLQGKVPRSLIYCKHLEFLDLGNNELNDTFPNWLGTLPYLKILSLRSNRLHGSIQTSRNEKLFAQLRVIDLSSNGFSGNLPVNLFENFEAMKLIDEKNGTPRYVGDRYGYYECSLNITTKGSNREFVRVSTSNIVIDLSKNRFEGHIPSIIGDLSGLRTLNLSHNGLEGVIPTSLQHLSVLESLDLSSNKIGGEIPQQLVSLTSLEVLNLSHNHLVGCIPKGKQFDTFEDNSYQGNDGLHGFPLSKDCGVDDGVPQATTSVELDQGEEGDSAIISWQAFLMGYGCGLVVVLSVIYIMLATQSPAWFSRMVEELEHKSIARMKKHKKRY